MVESEEIQIEVVSRTDLSQQHGYMHAGVALSIVDSARGYAALWMADPEMEVLTVELKVNLMGPGSG